MRCIETIHAQGHVLCHDITVIVRGVKKGVAFKKGHVVTEEDIPELLKLGKLRAEQEGTFEDILILPVRRNGDADAEDRADDAADRPE